MTSKAEHYRVRGPTQSGTTVVATRCTKGEDKPFVGQRMPGAGLGKVSPEMPAFQPYRGKLAVRNDRGDRGNVGIIRSPIRASILPDLSGTRTGGFAVMQNAARIVLVC